VPGTRGIIDGVAGDSAEGAVAGGVICGWLVVADMGAAGFIGEEFADCATDVPADAINRQSIAA
jgi:hypothetical protein